MPYVHVSWETKTTWGTASGVLTATSEPPAPDNDDPPVAGRPSWEPYAGGIEPAAEGWRRWTAWRRARVVTLNVVLGLESRAAET